MTIGTLLASLPQRTRVPFGANLPRLLADAPADWPDGTEAPEQTCDRPPTNPGHGSARARVR